MQTKTEFDTILALKKIHVLDVNGTEKPSILEVTAHVDEDAIDEMDDVITLTTRYWENNDATIEKISLSRSDLLSIFEAVS